MEKIRMMISNALREKIKTVLKSGTKMDQESNKGSGSYHRLVQIVTPYFRSCEIVDWEIV